MADTTLHELATPRGQYRLVSPPGRNCEFAYIMCDGDKLGETHVRPGGQRVLTIYGAQTPEAVGDIGRLCAELGAVVFFSRL